MSKRVKFLAARVMPLFFIISGSGTLLVGIWMFYNAAISINWPHTNAKIIHSDLGLDGTAGQSADIRYEFEVNGETYTGNRVGYGDYVSSDSMHVINILKKYPKGKDVTVYYNPDNPKNNLLEPGIKLQTWFLPVFGIIFLGIGILQLIFVPKLIRKFYTIKDTT